MLGQQQVALSHDRTKVIPKESRRLDSLARLMEFNRMCAAVSIIELEEEVAGNKLRKKKLLVANNEIFVGAGDKKYSTDKGKTEEIWDEVRRAEFDEKTKALFVRLVKDKIKPVLSGNQMLGTTIGDDDLERMSKEFFDKEDPIGWWNNSSISDLKKSFNGPIKLPHAVFVYSACERVYADIKKLKNELSDPESGSLLKKNLEIELIKHDGNNVHAEMRIVGRLLEKLEVTDNPQPVYVGISKKCCAKCDQVMQAVNNALQNTGLIKVIYAGDATEEDVDIREYAGVSNFQFRGNHVGPGGNWEAPGFLSNTSSLSKAIKSEYDKILASGNLPPKAGAHYDQFPENSDSEPETPRSSTKSSSNQAVESVSSKTKGVGPFV